MSMLKRLGNFLLQGTSSANTTFDSDLDTSEEEKCAVIDEFSMGKRNYKVYDSDINNINFMERIEIKPTPISRSWVLRSGTNVGDKLARYVDTIPEVQKCLK